MGRFEFLILLILLAELVVGVLGWLFVKYAGAEPAGVVVFAFLVLISMLLLEVFLNISAGCKRLRKLFQLPYCAGTGTNKVLTTKAHV